MKTLYDQNRIVPLNRHAMRWFNLLGYCKRQAMKRKYFGSAYFYLNFLQVMTIYALEHPNKIN